MLNLTRFLAFISCVLMLGCHSINQRLGLPDDNQGEELLEEIAETVVQFETDFRPTFDFTPESVENK